MDVVLLGLAIVTLSYLLFVIIECIVGYSGIMGLAEQAVLPHEQLPSISIIFSALNEDASLEKTLNSFLALNYPKLEIIAINDRSTDKTGMILETMQQLHPELKVCSIKELPDGWLGKNHALHYGSQLATSDWLLFTDADVLMSNTIVAKAISYALEKKMDHITIFEHHIRKKFWLNAILLGTYVAYSMVIKPWRIRYAWSKSYLGHGAFNLVNKQAYQHCGGHSAIAMECFDDMKLGKLLKKNGYKQDVVNGKDLIEREWYSSVQEMVKGLQKNGFAHFNFRFSKFLIDFTFSLLFFLWPFCAVIVFSGMIQWLNFTIIILTFYLYSYVAKQFRMNSCFAFLYPIAMCMLFYTIWNSVITTYKNNGIIWRNTHYPLNKLKNKNTNI